VTKHSWKLFVSLHSYLKITDTVSYRDILIALNKSGILNQSGFATISQGKSISTNRTFGQSSGESYLANVTTLILHFSPKRVFIISYIATAIYPYIGINTKGIGKTSNFIVLHLQVLNRAVQFVNFLK